MSREPALLPLLVFMAMHAPFAFVLRSSPTIATLHALATMATGLAFLRDRHAEKLVYVCGYIATMEILWRASYARIFYESGKYALALLLALAVFRFGKFSRNGWLPLLFAAFLLPSLVALPYFDRREIAFNLSGGVALGVTTFFFSAVRFERLQIRRLLIVMMGPILGLAALATRSSLEIDLSTIVAGSKATTAGIGPNQVSTILGLGIVLSLLLSFLIDRRAWLRWFFWLAAVWLTAQCLLSLSRGGLWSAFGSAIVAGIFLLQGRRSRGWLVAVAVLSGVLLNYAVIPVLNEATAGRLEQRLRDTGLTGRDKIIRADMEAFRENPVFGAGPGQSKYYHARTFGLASAHTEYSRLIAEHGAFGLMAIAILGWLCFARLIASHSAMAKAITLSMTTWALLSMFHSAIRLSAVPFLFALGSAYFSVEPTTRRSIER